MKVDKEMEYMRLSRELTQLFRNRDYEQFNKKRIRVCELFQQLDNPFREGDIVEHKSGNGWKKTKICEIRSNSEVVTTIVIAPFTNFRFPVEKVVEQNEDEQLTLF